MVEWVGCRLERKGGWGWLARTGRDGVEAAMGRASGRALWGGMGGTGGSKTALIRAGFLEYFID